MKWTRWRRKVTEAAIAKGGNKSNERQLTEDIHVAVRSSRMKGKVAMSGMVLEQKLVQVMLVGQRSALN